MVGSPCPGAHAIYSRMLRSSGRSTILLIAVRSELFIGEHCTAGPWKVVKYDEFGSGGCIASIEPEVADASPTLITSLFAALKSLLIPTVVPKFAWKLRVGTRPDLEVVSRMSATVNEPGVTIAANGMDLDLYERVVQMWSGIEEY